MAPRVPLIAAFLLAAACGGPEGSNADGGRPSVIFISLDTLRQDRCGFHGYERDTTPFLDSLAEDSLVFDRAYATAAWTLISHMTMLTGLYPMQHKVVSAEAALSERVPTIVELMDAQGAVTAGVHFPGWLDARFGYGRGYDVYSRAKSVVDTKRVLNEITEPLEGRWSWLFVHLFDIHSSSLVPDDARIYGTPPPYDTMFDPEVDEVLAGMDAESIYVAIPETFTERQREAVRALYDGGIRRVDDQLKVWFHEWEQRGLLDNAIVIITSDHGEGLGLRENRFEGHGSFFEEGLRVPLLIHFTPGAREWIADEVGIDPSTLRGRRDDLVSHVDLVPTLLEALDLPVTLEYPGVSLLREVPADRWIHAQRPPNHAASYRGMRKYQYSPKGQFRWVVDLDKDPGEWNTDPPRGAALEIALAEYAEALEDLEGLVDPGAAAASGGLDANSRARLSELGYGAEVGER